MTNVRRVENAAIREIPSRRPAYGLREIEISRKGLLRDMKGRNLAELRQAVNLNASQMSG
jgi:hypothetical protein